MKKNHYFYYSYSTHQLRIEFRSMTLIKSTKFIEKFTIRNTMSNRVRGGMQLQMFRKQILQKTLLQNLFRKASKKTPPTRKVRCGVFVLSSRGNSCIYIKNTAQYLSQPKAQINSWYLYTYVATRLWKKTKVYPFHTINFNLSMTFFCNINIEGNSIAELQFYSFYSFLHDLEKILVIMDN